jgi:SAM-dependent methyltransferase
MRLADCVIPLQARFVRPLADAADHSEWVPATLGQALRRIDGTCSLDVRPNGGVTSAGSVAPVVRHPIIARLYAAQAEKADALGLAERRRQLVASLSGRVLEIGAGTGANFAHFPHTVTEAVAIEPEPFLRGRARQAAADAPVPVRVLDAPAEKTPFEDAVFDAAIASLVLCSVSDPAAALRELYRVIRPGGELRFNEHVRSASASVAGIQRTADRLGWPHVSGGCHLARDSEAMILAAGFQIISLERYRFRIPPLDPPKPHIIGTARKPATDAART